MGSTLITHPCATLSFLWPHFNSRSVSHGSVSGDFGVELVQVDPEVIKSIDEIPAKRVVEDVLWKF